MAKTKKLCFMAVLTAIALTIFMIENQLPSPVPIPGIKLGLANIITLTAMAILGRKEAGAILAARLIFLSLEPKGSSLSGLILPSKSRGTTLCIVTDLPDPLEPLKSIRPFTKGNSCSS